jgi:hypothetical protein
MLSVNMKLDAQQGFWNGSPERTLGRAAVGECNREFWQ